MALETKLLIADADASIRGIVALFAAEEGWRCDAASDGISVLKLLRREQYDLVILDTDLAGVDGKIICRHLRKTTRIPVIFLSMNGAETERLEGFAAGGNDYLVKPFYPRELVARIKNLLMLCGHSPARTKSLTVGGIRIDLESRAVTVDGQGVPLTPKEYDLLLFFARNPQQAFSRDALLDLVWGQGFDGTDRTVDSHVKSLRGKIRPHQDYIVTVWGYGYKFAP